MGGLREYYWLFGVALVLGGSAISNVGVNLQKLTHVKRERGRRRREEEGNEEDGEGKEGSEGEGGEVREDGSVTVTVVCDDGREVEEAVSVEESERIPLTPSGGGGGGTFSSSTPPPPSSSASSSSSSSSAAHTPYYKQPLWLLGLSFVILGSVADFVALGFAAQTVVAPLGAFTLVTNVWFAQVFSGERVSSRDLLATGTIIVGCVVSVAFANHADRGYTFDELFSFYTSARFAAYSTVIGAAVLVLYASAHRAGRRRQAMLAANSPAVLEYHRLGRLQRYHFGALSGIVGAQSVLFAKSFAELAREGIGELWSRYEAWLIIVGMASCIFGQIKWLNAGLKEHDALFMVPCFQAHWIVFSVVGGLVVYNEAAAMSTAQGCVFSLGIAVTVFGVYLLSQRGAGGAAGGDGGFAGKDLYMQVAAMSPELGPAVAAAAAEAGPGGLVIDAGSGLRVRSPSSSPTAASAPMSPGGAKFVRPAALPGAADLERAAHRRRRSRSDSLTMWLPNMGGHVADIRHHEDGHDMLLDLAANARRVSVESYGSAGSSSGE